jgi:hypothetical protein
MAELVVARLHALSCERTRVFDFLFAYSAPTRLLGRVVLVGRPAVQDPARSELLLESRVFRVIGIFRVFLGMPVRKTLCPVMNAARPAVQDCSPYESVNRIPSLASRSMLGVR